MKESCLRLRWFHQRRYRYTTYYHTVGILPNPLPLITNVSSIIWRSPFIFKPKQGIHSDAMTRRNQQRAEGWSMYPDLHDDVATLLQNVGLNFVFHPTDEEHSAVETYNTNVVGHFECQNRNCKSRRWSSGVIATRIRMYNGDSYNARVYHQQCTRCKQISRPMLDGSYAERVAYRIKKWLGIAMETAPYSGSKTTPPHRKDLCEGCRNGHCPRG